MDELAALLEKARHDPRVAAVLLFGSRARGDPSARDTDVALVLRAGAVRDAFGVRLAYASEAREPRLDVQVFQALPLYVRMRVLRDAHALLVNDQDALYAAALAAAREWEDFRPFYEAYLEGAGVA